MDLLMSVGLAEGLTAWKFSTNKWQKPLFIPWKGEEMLTEKEAQL